MERTINFGKENLNGNLLNAPLDGTNVSTDWICDIWDDFTYCRSETKPRTYLGYLKWLGKENVCELTYSDYKQNYVDFYFPCMIISKEMFDTFCYYIKDFFTNSDNDITIKVKELSFCLIRISFYWREED